MSRSKNNFTEEERQREREVIAKLNKFWDEYKALNERLEELELRMLEREKKMLELKIEKRQIEAKLNEQGRERPRRGR